MIKYFTTALLLCATTMAHSQTDTLKKAETTDTIKAGNFIIIKKNKEVDKKEKKTSITFNIGGGTTKKTKSNISTNYFIFDLGFANYRDETNYTLAQNTGYLQQRGPNGKPDANTNALNTGKSSNVNIWLFMQRVNMYHHKLNLKYGLGLEMYNFRYDRSLSYRKDPVPFAYTDSISFSKNKLFAEYITIPLMVNFKPKPDSKKGFSISAGVSAGYLIASRNKQISAERGKVKYNGDFNLNPWRLAAIAEIGLGPIRLYGSYSFNTLHKEATGMAQYPYSVGIRFSHF